MTTSGSKESGASRDQNARRRARDKVEQALVEVLPGSGVDSISFTVHTLSPWWTFDVEWAVQIWGYCPQSDSVVFNPREAGSRSGGGWAAGARRPLLEDTSSLSAGFPLELAVPCIQG
jgi:hypothetical protein